MTPYLLIILLIMLALAGAPLFHHYRGRGHDRFPLFGRWSFGGVHRIIPHRQHPHPPGPASFYGGRVHPGRKQHLPAPGPPDQGLFGVDAFRPGHCFFCGLRPVHRVYRRLGSDHRGPGRPALPRPGRRRISGTVQPGPGDHFRQPGVVVPSIRAP